LVDGRSLYLDASALVKLVLGEAESVALRAYLVAARLGQLTSVISAVELPRAAARSAPADTALVGPILGHLGLIALDVEIARLAAGLRPVGLRSLDAIHLASALTVAADLEALVTYDVRLADAARSYGLVVVSPG
jgi:uncharacterized protein